ncbi:MAG: HPr(Ser) kinase/phosphatase [Verrucomicrobiae bacterium]|nr:HPr(Ser) kinase/phosphatase [Verrucomicrobiae bacterium]MDW8343302.1 HPr(Ser) kinase/phosphatase [Verrucomicrobiae bacterium]
MSPPSTVVTVEKFYLNHAQTLQLKLVAGGAGLSRPIREGSINRPGLALAGFLRYFAYKRVQVIGGAEHQFLKSLTPSEAVARIEAMLRRKIPCLVFARNLQPPAAVEEACERMQTPLFRTPMSTMKFINAATIALEMDFAPTVSEQGSMVDILGIGVLIRGESGVGKSESVLALIERGYSLVSDDVTRIRLMEGRELIGTSAETTRYHMEVRGLGIINVPAIFGVASVRTEKRLDLVVTLLDWHKMTDIERTGLEQHTYNILGIEVPHVTIPVRPGRDLARLIEVAALDQKLKSMGHNAAREFNERLIARMRGASGLLPST